MPEGGLKRINQPSGGLSRHAQEDSSAAPEPRLPRLNFSMPHRDKHQSQIGTAKICDNLKTKRVKDDRLLFLVSSNLSHQVSSFYYSYNSFKLLL
jgi:hypothetical protein